MFKTLLPKEETYFDDFKEMIGIIQEMATHAQKIFQFEEMHEHILKMKPLELRCDEITYRITQRLNKTFITPFDREDIFSLVKRLDDISDMLLGASLRVETFKITERDEAAQRLASIITAQVSELGVAIQDLKFKHMNEVRSVKVLEMEADKVYAQALKELFENEKNAIDLIKKKELYDILERTSDRCQSTANIIMAIFIKNS